MKCRKTKISIFLRITQENEILEVLFKKSHTEIIVLWKDDATLSALN